MVSGWCFPWDLLPQVDISESWEKTLLRARHRHMAKALPPVYALKLGVPLVDGLAVAAPRIVGDAVACGLAVAVARGVGDALPASGSGEAVAAVEAVAAGDAGAPGLT